MKIFIKKKEFFNLTIFKKTEHFIQKILDIKTIYILFFLFLVAFIPRILYINAGLLHHDSVQTAIATEKTLETGRLEGISDGRYVYILINSLFYFFPHFLFGVQSSELTVNVVTIFFSSLSVIIMYLFSRELLNDKYIAFSSSILLSFMPIYLSATTYAKSHAHSLFFILLSGYFLIKLIKINSKTYKTYSF